MIDPTKYFSKAGTLNLFSFFVKIMKMFKISAKIHEQVPYKSEVNGAVDISCHMVLQK